MRPGMGKGRDDRERGQQVQLDTTVCQLDALYRQHKRAGFVIQGFPANKFGEQEPGANAETWSSAQRNTV